MSADEHRINASEMKVLKQLGLLGGNVTSDGWQVTLCDPTWHVSSRSGEAFARTAIHDFTFYLSLRLAQ